MRQLIFLLCALPFLVGVDPQGLPEGILARFRGGSVSLAEYRDFLYLAQARSRLEELVEWKLLRQRAEELGQPAGPEEIARRVEAERGKILQGRYKGDRKAMTATFLHQGYSPAEMARWCVGPWMYNHTLGRSPVITGRRGFPFVAASKNSSPVE